MPHLRFEVNRSIPDAAKIALAEHVRQLFANVMGSGTDHISISIYECGTYDLSIGRVTEPGKGVAIVDADIRKGRTIDQRRALALGFIELLQKNLGIPPEHVYVTFTEHKGEDFHMSDRYLADWREGEERTR
jgi:phenylpyruvate tautomerase PptA (4-oxalocrotonate tautomerase family)